MCECFFSTLKREMNASDGFRSCQGAELLIFDYIEIYFNRKRRHSALGCCSPVEYERRQMLPSLHKTLSIKVVPPHNQFRLLE